MTVDTSQCVNDEYPNFPWNDFDSMMQLVDNQSNPRDMLAGPSTATQSNSPPIKYCGKLIRRYLLLLANGGRLTVPLNTLHQTDYINISNAMRIYKELVWEYRHNVDSLIKRNMETVLCAVGPMNR